MDGGGGCDDAAARRTKKKRNDYPRASSLHIKRGGRVFRQMRKGSVSLTHIISRNDFQGVRVIYAGI